MWSSFVEPRSVREKCRERVLVVEVVLIVVEVEEFMEAVDAVDARMVAMRVARGQVVRRR